MKLALALALCAAAVAQVPGIGSRPDSPPPPAPTDPLGRSTPRGCILGFLRAAQLDRFEEASRYLQSKDPTAGPRLARQLRTVMDYGFRDRIDSISSRPEGFLDDSLPPEHDDAGMLRLGSEQAPLILVRVPDERIGGSIWLVSAQTLAKIPALYDAVGFPKVEEKLPEFMVRTKILSTPLWQWIASFTAFPLALGLAWLLMRFVLGGLTGKPASLGDWKFVVGAPIALLFGLLLHWGFITYLGAPLLSRYYYERLLTVALVLVVGWLLWRLLDIGTKRLIGSAASAGEQAGTLMVLGRRILKAFLFVGIVMATLSAMGFQTTGLLTTLGIGGIAIALAAQKTIENLIGGLTLVSDEVFRVGDACKLGDRTGVIEDIGLRSTRVRTPERSELSIPNGTLAAMNIENLSRRDRILINQTFLIRIDTSPDQLRYVLDECRKMLLAHPKIFPDGARFRLVGLEDSGFRVELFAQVNTPDALEWLAVREEILLRTVEVIESAGTALAPRLEHQADDKGLDGVKRAAAEKKVRGKS
ncbi:MAG: mechanosensitive ion channel family protein [Bryobacteraceae bacterium]